MTTDTPFTVERPPNVPAEMCQPGTFAIVHAYVPFGAANEIVGVTELSVIPFYITAQFVPAGSPDSVHVMA